MVLLCNVPLFVCILTQLIKIDWLIECVLFQNLTNLDRSRFVKGDRSGRGHLVLVCAKRRRPRPLLQVNTIDIMNINELNRRRRRPAAQMGVAKPDFSQMCRSRSDLIENAERYTRIDLDLSDFEKEYTHW